MCLTGATENMRHIKFNDTVSSRKSHGHRGRWSSERAAQDFLLHNLAFKNERDFGSGCIPLGDLSHGFRLSTETSTCDALTAPKNHQQECKLKTFVHAWPRGIRLTLGRRVRVKIPIAIVVGKYRGRMFRSL